MAHKPIAQQPIRAWNGLGHKRIVFLGNAIWRTATCLHRLAAAGLNEVFVRLRRRIAVLIPRMFPSSIPVVWRSPLMAMTRWWPPPLVTLGGLRRFERRSGAARHHR
jgi:hypothetical protein